MNKAIFTKTIENRVRISPWIWILIILIIIGIGTAVYFIFLAPDCWVPGDSQFYKIFRSPETSLTCYDKLDKFIASNNDESLCDKMILHYWPFYDPNYEYLRKKCHESFSTK